FKQRMELIESDPELPGARLHGATDAKLGFIGYGGVYGPILEAVERMGAGGEKGTFPEKRTLWSLPRQPRHQFVDNCDVVYVTEYSAGAQLRGLVQRESTGPMKKLKSLLRYDGRLMTPGWIINKIKES